MIQHNDWLVINIYQINDQGRVLYGIQLLLFHLSVNGKSRFYVQAN